MKETYENTTKEKRSTIHFEMIILQKMVTTKPVFILPNSVPHFVILYFPLFLTSDPVEICTCRNLSVLVASTGSFYPPSSEVLGSLPIDQVISLTSQNSFHSSPDPVILFLFMFFHHFHSSTLRSFPSYIVLFFFYTCCSYI